MLTRLLQYTREAVTINSFLAPENLIISLLSFNKVYARGTTIFMKIEDSVLSVVELNRMPNMIVVGLEMSILGMVKWITLCLMDIFSLEQKVTMTTIESKLFNTLLAC